MSAIVESLWDGVWKLVGGSEKVQARLVVESIVLCSRGSIGESFVSSRIQSSLFVDVTSLAVDVFLRKSISAAQSATRIYLPISNKSGRLVLIWDNKPRMSRNGYPAALVLLQ